MRRISFCSGNDVERQTNSWCKRAGAGATLLVFLLARAACADGLQAGQWKTVQSPEIDGVAGRRRNHALPDAGSRARSREDFQPISRTTNSTCERTEHELTPQQLKWRLQCTGQIDMDVAGDFIFVTPEHYTATITARSFMLGRLMQSVRTSIDAQRVGECP
jgi:hypothetical protein